LALITIAFIIIFIGGIIAAIFVNGAWAFYAYQLVYFMNPDDRWWGSTIPSLSYSFITVMVMAYAVYIRNKHSSNEPLISCQPLTKWFLLIFFLYIVLFIFALDLPAHKTATFQLAKLFIVIGLAYKLIKNEKALNLALWCYVLGATYIGYEALSRGRTGNLRVEGIGTVDAPNANSLAAAITPALVLLIYFSWMGNKYIKAASIVCAAFIINALVLINSRGAFLAAVVGGAIYICYMLFSKHQRKNQRFMAVLVITSGLIGAFSLTDSYFWERMATIKEYEDGEKSGSHRIEFWMATFDMLEDHPMGVGARGYNRISKNYLNPEKYGDKSKSVHSTWFQGLSEIGWLGLFCFIGLIICCFRILKKMKNYLTLKKQIDEYFLIVAIETAFISFLVAATFINRFRAETLYWLILFIACAFNIYFIQKQGQGGKKNLMETKLNHSCEN